METLYLLIPVSIVLVFLIIAVLWWAVKAGQFEDMQGPGEAILFDDDSVRTPSPATQAATHLPEIPENTR